MLCGALIFFLPWLVLILLICKMPQISGMLHVCCAPQAPEILETLFLTS